MGPPSSPATLRSHQSVTPTRVRAGTAIGGGEHTLARSPLLSYDQEVVLPEDEEETEKRSQNGAHPEHARREGWFSFWTREEEDAGSPKWRHGDRARTARQLPASPPPPGLLFPWTAGASHWVAPGAAVAGTSAPCFGHLADKGRERARVAAPEQLSQRA